MGSNREPKTKYRIVDSAYVQAVIRTAAGKRINRWTTWRIVDRQFCILPHDKAVRAIHEVLRKLKTECPAYFQYIAEKRDCDDREAIMNGRLHEKSISSKSPFGFAFGFIDGDKQLYPGIDEAHAAMWGLTEKGLFILEPANGKYYKLTKRGGEIWTIGVG